MNRKRVRWCLTVAIVAFVTLTPTTGCVEEITPETPEEQLAVPRKTIPYTAQATLPPSEAASKITVDFGLNYLYQAKDTLRIYGEDASGVLSGDLTMQGDAMEETATFHGTLEWTGEGNPSPDMIVTATLISEFNMLNGTDYSHAVAELLDKAVQRYSRISGTGRLGDKHFHLQQHSVFIVFDIDMDGMANPGKCRMRVHNNAVTVQLTSIDTLKIDNRGHAKFTVAFDGGTVLNQAQLYIDGLIVRFGGKTPFTLPAGKKYAVNKKVDIRETPLTLQSSGVYFNVYIGGVVMSPSSFSYTMNGSTKVPITRASTKWFAPADALFQFYDNNPSNHGRIRVESDGGYMYGNFMSVVNSLNYPGETELTESAVFEGFLRENPSLTNHPTRPIVLPATTLTENCYAEMFSGTGLQVLPVDLLPADTLAPGCYAKMFENCASLASVTCLATDISAAGSLTDWLSGVAASGTFTKKEGVGWPTGASGIPDGWTVIE